MKSCRTDSSAATAPVLLAPLFFVLLSGCATPTPERPASPAYDLKGKTRQELLACAGYPTSESKRGKGPVLVYYREAWTLERNPTSIEGSMKASRPGCQAEITLEDDRVTDARYVPIPESAGTVDHCRRIFSRCGD